MKIFLWSGQVLWVLLTILNNILYAATLDLAELDRFLATQSPTGQYRTFIPNIESFVFVSAAKILTPDSTGSILHTENILDGQVVIIFNNSLPGHVSLAHLDNDFIGNFEDLITPLSCIDRPNDFVITIFGKNTTVTTHQQQLQQRKDTTVKFIPSFIATSQQIENLSTLLKCTLEVATSILQELFSSIAIDKQTGEVFQFSNILTEILYKDVAQSKQQLDEYTSKKEAIEKGIRELLRLYHVPYTIADAFKRHAPVVTPPTSPTINRKQTFSSPILPYIATS